MCIRPEVIGGLFSLGAALIAFFGGIIAANINNKKKERLEEIKELKDTVKLLATEVINYSKVEDALVGELKEWSHETKKTIRANYSNNLFGNANHSLMATSKAQGIIDKYLL